jgi:DNA-binding response OmpR family regulator
MKKWILIADDDSVICNGLSDALRDEGFEVVTAENGEDAVNLIEAQNFNLLILDLKMPRMNGFEVLQKMKNDNVMVKSIVLTGNLLDSSLSDENRKTLDLAAHVMTKPFEMEELLESIREYIS